MVTYLFMDAISFPTNFEKAFTDKLNETLPPNIKLKDCMQIMAEHKLLYKLPNVNPKLFFVHRANRGGLGLSPFNCHRNAATIVRVGGDRKALVNALACELPPVGIPRREEHIDFNTRLISKSNDLLAPVNGTERFVTLGCGHTVAFCKTAQLAGHTSEEQLADADGKIDLHMIEKDSELSAMIHQGWDWDIVPWTIDVKFPKFAHVAQAALNASNHVPSLVSVLETAVTLAKTMSEPILQVGPSNDWEQLALASVKAVCAPCASYAHVILRYVKQFSGGPGAPLVVFMDMVAKQIHCTVNLGETTWATIEDMHFFNKEQKPPS